MFKNNKFEFGTKEIKLLKVYLFFALFALLYDLFKFPVFIIVKNEFIFTVFGSITTISMISISLHSILIGSINLNFYGFKLNDILYFKSNHYIFSNAIYITFMFILFSFFALFLGFVNLLSALFISTLTYIAIIAFYIWLIIFSEEYKVDLINAELESIISNQDNEKLIKFHYRFWNYFLIDFFVKGNNYDYRTIEFIERGLEILSKGKYSTIFYDMFNDLVDQQGKYSHYFISDVYFKLFSDKFKKNQKISKAIDDNIIKNVERNLRENIELNIGLIPNYFESNEFSVDLKSTLLYISINSLYYSSNTSLLYKEDIYYKLLLAYFNNFDDFEEIDFVFINTVLIIFKKFVLISFDYDNSKLIYITIFSILKKKLIFSNNESYSLLLGLILYSNFVYAFKEKETLIESHKTILSGFIELKFSPIANNQFNIAHFVREEMPYIILNIAKHINLSDFDAGIDYFPDWIDIKSTTWSEESWISFQFSLFFLIEESIDFKSVLDNYNLNNDDQFRNVNNLLSSLFEGGNLGENFTNETKEIASWLSYIYRVDNFKESSVFNIINSFQVENTEKTILKKVNEIVNLDQIKQIIITRIESLIKGVNDETLSEYKHTFENTISLIENPFYPINDISDYFIKRVKRLILNYINSNTKIIRLNSNYSNISSIIDSVKEYCISAINLTSPCFNTINFEKNELKDLRQKIQELSIIDSIFFTNMLLKKNDTNIFISNISINITNLNEFEIQDQLSQIYVSNGLYKVHYAYLDLDKAREFISKGFKKVELKFTFHTNFTKDSGLRIEYDYSNLS